MSLPSLEKRIHYVFEITLLLKAFYAVTEILGGVLALLISKSYLMNSVLLFTQDELSEDPKDLIAHYLIQGAQNFSVTSQHFVAFYLVSHGIVKLFLIIGLLRKKLWAYPLSIVVFGLFIFYQIYRYSYTHSMWLFLLTILDIIIIWLTLHEYRYMKKHSLFEK